MTNMQRILMKGKGSHFLLGPINVHQLAVFGPKTEAGRLMSKVLSFWEVLYINAVFTHNFILFLVRLPFSCLQNINFAIITNVFISILYMQEWKLKAYVLENDSYV